MSCQFRTVHSALRATAALMAICLALSACGGGGGEAVGTLPPPPPAPPPPPPPPSSNAIIPAATTTQEFITQGATFTRSTATSAFQGPLLAADQQIRIRYDASDQHYEVRLPGSATWDRLSGSAGDFETANGVGFALIPSLAGLFSHSAIASWSNSANLGYVAAGIPTPAGAVPSSGSATYTGYIAGASTEVTVHPVHGSLLVFAGGSITLAFDFAAGTLSGSTNPILSYSNQTLNLPTLTFANTVYSSGNASFSGQFATSLPGLNAFSGRFTGPAAQELVGSFAFPYSSPVDGQVYVAGGALAAKRP